MSVALLAPSAHAACVSVTQCFCSGESEIMDARIAGIDGARVTLEALAVHTVADGGAIIDALPVQPRAAGDFVGRRVLVFVEPHYKNVTKRLPVEVDGQVACTADFRLPADDVIRVAMDRGTCKQTLYGMGLSEPPCKDTGPGCSTVPAAPTLALLVLGTALLRRRVRPRRFTLRPE